MAYFLSLALSFISLSILATDLGTYGQTFEVHEENLMQYLKQKSQQLSMEKINLKLNSLRPKFTPVSGFCVATIYRKFYFDPTVCSQEDIFDHQGNLVVPKGKCTNPLDHTSLAAPLLFLDGNNETHLAWARKQPLAAKWILVSGDPLSVEQTEKREIFFDQQGQLSQKLSLKYVPVKVSQEDQLLCIEEYPMQEAPCAL